MIDKERLEALCEKYRKHSSGDGANFREQLKKLISFADTTLQKLRDNIDSTRYTVLGDWKITDSTDGIIFTIQSTDQNPTNTEALLWHVELTASDATDERAVSLFKLLEAKHNGREATLWAQQNHSWVHIIRGQLDADTLKSCTETVKAVIAPCCAGVSIEEATSNKGKHRLVVRHTNGPGCVRDNRAGHGKLATTDFQFGPNNKVLPEGLGEELLQAMRSNDHFKALHCKSETGRAASKEQLDMADQLVKEPWFLMNGAEDATGVYLQLLVGCNGGRIAQKPEAELKKALALNQRAGKPAQREPLRADPSLHFIHKDKEGVEWAIRKRDVESLLRQSSDASEEIVLRVMTYVLGLGPQMYGESELVCGRQVNGWSTEVAVIFSPNHFTAVVPHRDARIVDVLDSIAYNRPSTDGRRTANKYLLNLLRARFTSAEVTECQARFVNCATQPSGSNLCAFYSLMNAALHCIVNTDRFADLKLQLGEKGVTGETWHRVTMPDEKGMRHWLAEVLRTGKLVLPPVSIKGGSHSQPDVMCTLRASKDQLQIHPSPLFNARWLLRLDRANAQKMLIETVAATLRTINDQWSNKDNAISINFLKHQGILAIPEEHWVNEAFEGRYVHNLHEVVGRVQRKGHKEQQKQHQMSDDEEELVRSDSGFASDPPQTTLSETDDGQGMSESPSQPSQSDIEATGEASAPPTQQHSPNKAPEVGAGSTAAEAGDCTNLTITI
jgi:hypothetical protein